MTRSISPLAFLLVTFALTHFIQEAQLASFVPTKQPRNPNDNQVFASYAIIQQPSRSPASAVVSQEDSSSKAGTNLSTTPLPVPDGGGKATTNTTVATTTATTPITTTTADPNADPDELVPLSTPPNGAVTLQTPGQGDGPPGGGGGKDQPDRVANNNNKSKPLPDSHGGGGGLLGPNGSSSSSVEMNVLFYSIFIVYVALIKLIYHSVNIIKRNLTEAGVLMIFGIIWELVVRQLSSNYEAFPRFNSKIFFYLFLPSTVLEAAALLSNKWLFLNLLPILMHSIFGTLFYASSLGFTIYSLSRQNVFNLNIPPMRHPAAVATTGPLFASSSPFAPVNFSSLILHESGGGGGDGKPPAAAFFAAAAQVGNTYSQPAVMVYEKNYQEAGTRGSAAASAASMEINNLTLADCLVFGTILSSVDSTTMLGVFNQFHVNEKLYYLALGESLMNNAVVLVIFELLLDFFNATRLTVVKIYIAIIQFFITLIGSVFIGLLLALVALVSVRLTRRFQAASSSSGGVGAPLATNYQNQCQAMLETLLILKLAYLTYTIAQLASTSSIISLATFGILQDQYIKYNLNLRSQLTYRQVVLAARTLGFSLVYPLLGMLLVEVANTSQFFQAWFTFEQLAAVSSSSSGSHHHDAAANAGQSSRGGLHKGVSGEVDETGTAAQHLFTAASVAASKLSHLANQANLHWNFKFLSLVTLLTVVYRFVVVIGLSLLCNLFSSSQLKIRFKEQVIVAFGGLKGPLAFAMVFKLIEHEEHRDRTMRNKHLFMYTVLFIIFVSTLIKGSFIRPLVSKLHISVGLHHSGGLWFSSSGGGAVVSQRSSATVFDQINCRLLADTAHGLNSILGHSKSSYDRFLEFNETHIKPWLARDGSNTNWLSVFYDQLILDETLNANSFHRSAAATVGATGFGFSPIQPLLSANNHQQQQPIETAPTHWWHSGRRQSKVPTTANSSLASSARRLALPLEPIDENNRLLVRARDQRKRSLLPVVTNVSRRRSSLVSRRLNSFDSSRRLAQENSSQQPGSAVVDPATGNAMLKEFVLFNLKLEDAKRRRLSTAVVNRRGRRGGPKASRAGPASSSVASHEDSPAGPSGVAASQVPDVTATVPQAALRMLSTTTSDDSGSGADQEMPAIWTADNKKLGHLSHLEKRLQENGLHNGNDNNSKNGAISSHQNAGMVAKGSSMPAPLPLKPLRRPGTRRLVEGPSSRLARVQQGQLRHKQQQGRGEALGRRPSDRQVAPSQRRRSRRGRRQLD